jgi:hypothetical protein
LGVMAVLAEWNHRVKVRAAYFKTGLGQSKNSRSTTAGGQNRLKLVKHDEPQILMAGKC